MGKKLKKIVYFFLKYHCPSAAEEFFKKQKLSSDDPPETTLENIYIDWKRLKSAKDDKCTQANLDLTEKKVITKQIQSVTDGATQPLKDKESITVKSIDNDATKIVNKGPTLVKPSTESGTKPIKKKESKPVQSKAKNDLNKVPALFNGLIPRPILHEKVLAKAGDSNEAERFDKYDSVIDSVVNRVCIEAQPISSPTKSPIKKAQVKKESSSLAAIKENMQKGLNKSFVNSNVPSEDTKKVPVVNNAQKPLLKMINTVNLEEAKDAETKVPNKKKAKKDKIKTLLEDGQDNLDVNNGKQITIDTVQTATAPNETEPDGVAMEVFSPLKTKKKKKAKATDESKKAEIQNGEPAKKKKKIETTPIPTPDLIKHPATNDLSLHNGFNSSSNMHSNSFVNDSESPELQEVRMSKPFRRIDVYGDIKIDPKLNNNSFEAMRGAANSWGEKANDVLKFTKGKSFKHEKTKKKRGTYSGGAITLGVNSVQFSDVDD